jgi:hypothetical protein
MKLVTRARTSAGRGRVAFDCGGLPVRGGRGGMVLLGLFADGLLGRLAGLVHRPRGYNPAAMSPLKAYVKNGRLVLDEATDHPEGKVIEPIPLDEVLAVGGDYLDDEERERLHRSIERGIEDAKAGHTVEARQVIHELRVAAVGR